jgi:ribulose-phosphate 3-epimerase
MGVSRAKPLEIAPSILSLNFSRIKEELENLTLAGIKTLHLDVMDGVFVPNLSFGPPVIHSIRPLFSGLLEAHLMISEPEKSLSDYLDAGCDRILIHPESTVHPHRLVQRIRSAGAQAGLALNPATSLDCLNYLWDDIDLVLLMTVNPGFGGQAFIASMKEKIKDFNRYRDSRKPLLLEVDGGVNGSNLAQLNAMGVDLAVVGSAIFNHQSTEENLTKLKGLL